MSRNDLSHFQTGPEEQLHDSLASVPPFGGNVRDERVELQYEMSLDP